MENNCITKRNELLGKRVVKALESRNFNAYFCNTKEDLIELFKSLITKEETFSWGGSITLEETGIKDFLENNGYKTFNREKAKSQEEREETVKQGMFCDNYLMSANAISEDGQIVNIDGTGGRVAAMCFGPKRVFVIAGMNKVVKTLDDALSRARNYAAPVNAKRIAGIFDIKTPCIETGSCADCKSETSICSKILTTRLCIPKGRITVILVNESLGY